MSYMRTEQARYETLLKPYTDAVELFRRQYRLYKSVPGVQRTITDGELMAACAFRTYEQFPQTSATEAACRTQACAQPQRWKTILKEYNQLEGAYSRKFPDADFPLKRTGAGAGRGKGKGPLTWDALMADYDSPAEDRKLLALLWPHVREMGHATDDRTVCVGYFAANVVLGLDQKRAVAQCRAHLKSLNLPSDAAGVSNRLQNILDEIGPTFETIVEMEKRKDKIAKTPGKGKGRVGLPRGVKSMPTIPPLKTTRSQRVVKELPLKRPREEAEETDDRVLPTPKRMKVDSSTRSESSVIEESDLVEAPPSSSEAEVENIVQIRIGRGNADLGDEGGEGNGDMDAMEVDEPIIPLKRKALTRTRQERSRGISKPERRPRRLVEAVRGEGVEEMDWPRLAGYRRRLIEARSKERDMTELSRARTRPVFADRKYWEVAV